MSEKRLAKMDGAKLVKNSGRGYEKGDAKLPPFLIDYKETPKSFTLNWAAWRKHANDAWDQGHQEPVIVVVLTEATLAIVDWEILKSMTKAYNYVMDNELWDEVEDG